MSLKLTRRHASPNWYLRGTIRGVTVDESTGVTDRKAAETIRAQREWGIIQASIHGRKATASFLEAAVGYMEGGGERRYMQPLLDHFGGSPLTRIDQAAIDRAAKVLYPTAAASTLNRQVYTPISAVLKHGAARGLCEYRQVERPAQPKGRVRWITPAEADRLITASAAHLRPLVIFLLYTGARVSEALYLDWRQVDLQRSHVDFIATKNGEARGVPLHPRAVAALASLPHRENEVFRRPDGYAYARKEDGGGQIKKAFRGACLRAGIADFSPHGCRHTWATWHYAANRDLPALMKLGGWKSEKMVLRYTHVNVAHLAQSIAALPWDKSGDRQQAQPKKRTRSVT
jgi:integrase